MSLVRRVLAAGFGIGTAKLTLTLHEEIHPRGIEGHATLLLEGGAVEQHIHTLSVTLDEFWQNYETRTLRFFPLATNLTIAPGSRHEYLLSFHLPDDARLSQQSLLGKPTAGCKLKAWADLGWWAVALSADATLAVTVHPELVAVHAALKSLGFEKGAWMHIFLPDAEVSQVDYHPPERWRDELTCVSLQPQIVGEWVGGKLVLHWHGQTLVDAVKAAFSGGKEEMPLRIPRGELRTRDGRPNSDGALPYLKKMLEDAVIPTDDPRYRLLRPASTPEDAAKTLLRPAAGSPTVSDEELLRPAAGPQDRTAGEPRHR